MGTCCRMSKHSPIGASKCERFWHCPGSETVYGRLPSSSSASAEEGRAAHALAEAILIEAYDPISQQWGLASNALADADEDMISAVMVYVDEVIRLSVEAVSVCFEQRFTLAHLDPEAFGTADAVILHSDSITVLDFKYGAGTRVDVAGNKQLLYYALGAYGLLPDTARERIKRVTVGIVQPRHPHAAGPIRYFSLSVENLLTFEQELKAAITRVRNSDTTLKAGSWCKFCPAKPTCPEALRYIDSFVPAFNLADKVAADIEAKTVEDIGNLLPFVAYIEDWLKQLKAKAHALAMEGQEIPGYKLVEGAKGNRKWVADAEAVLSRELGEDAYARTLKSPAQLEKVKHPRAKTLAAELTTRPPGALKLVQSATNGDPVALQNVNALLDTNMSDFTD
jgi:hypothetical protein